MGFNTDVDGFENSLTNWYKSAVNKAIVYGNGGAAKAVLYGLKKLNIDYIQVVRHVKSEKQIHMDEVSKTLFGEHDLIINCTPIGMYPQINEYLNIDNDWLNPSHHYYDLVYNPMETATMKLFLQHGAHVKSGLEMLHLQADKAWEIWTK